VSLLPFLCVFLSLSLCLKFLSIFAEQPFLWLCYQEECVLSVRWLFCCNQELLGVEFSFCCYCRFLFCQLSYSKDQFHRACAPFYSSEHQKYLHDNKKRMDFFSMERIACVCAFLYIFTSVYIYLRVRVCLLFIWVYFFNIYKIDIYIIYIIYIMCILCIIYFIIL